MSKSKSQFFRASVGALIVNAEGEALAFERGDLPGAWQLPQGGIDEGEEPIDAVGREILEETGIRQSDLALLLEYPDYLTYELPPEYRSDKTGRGQTQRWFVFRHTAANREIVLPAGEFVSWRWMPLEELIEVTASFRKGIYRRIAAAIAET